MWWFLLCSVLVLVFAKYIIQFGFGLLGFNLWMFEDEDFWDPMIAAGCWFAVGVFVLFYHFIKFLIWMGS